MPARPSMWQAACISSVSGALARGLPRRPARSMASRPDTSQVAVYLAAAAVSVKMPRPAPPSHSGSVACCHSASVSGLPAKASVAVRSARSARPRASAVSRGGSIARSYSSALLVAPSSNAHATCAADGWLESSRRSAHERASRSSCEMRFSRNLSELASGLPLASKLASRSPPSTVPSASTCPVATGSPALRAAAAAVM